jgi:hypothetical protein
MDTNSNNRILMPVQSADEDDLIRHRQHRATAFCHLGQLRLNMPKMARTRPLVGDLEACSNPHLLVLDNLLLMAGLPAFADALEDDARVASLSRASLASLSLCARFAFSFTSVRSFCFFAASLLESAGLSRDAGTHESYLSTASTCP